MPRYIWITKLVDDIIDNIGTVLEYAKSNFRSNEVYERIQKVNEFVKLKFKS